MRCSYSLQEDMGTWKKKEYGQMAIYGQRTVLLMREWKKGLPEELRLEVYMGMAINDLMQIYRVDDSPGITRIYQKIVQENKCYSLKKAMH